MKLVNYEDEHISELPFKFDITKLHKAYDNVNIDSTGIPNYQ